MSKPYALHFEVNLKTITSSQNADFKVYLSLLTASGVKKHNLALISGKKIVQERLAAGMEPVAIIVERPEENLPLTRQTQVPAELFHQLDAFNTKSPLLVVRCPEVPTFKTSYNEPLKVYLALQDPANLGAAIRSCVGFYVDQIILLQESCHPFHAKVTRSAVGCNFVAPLFKGPSIQQLNGEFISLDMQGENLYEFEFPTPTHLLIGEEGLGVPAHLKKRTVKIPMHNKVESLNAQTSLSVALSHYQSQKL